MLLLILELFCIIIELYLKIIEDSTCRLCTEYLCIPNFSYESKNLKQSGNSHSNNLDLSGTRIILVIFESQLWKKFNKLISLHSHKAHWNTGSLLQSVTGIKRDNSIGSLWKIKEKHGAEKCPEGRIFRCGDIVRLEHLRTKKNLHSTNFPSIIETDINESQEVNLILI